MPLICVFWMQLTRTNAVFSRTVLVSRFCAEIQLSGKSSEFMQKALFSQNTDGARRTIQVEARGPHTIRRRGLGGPRGPMVWPPRPASDALLRTIYWPRPKNARGRSRSRQKPSRTPPHRETPSREPEVSVLALRRDGELEEIIATITTDASPSTSHVSPIHV